MRSYAVKNENYMKSEKKMMVNNETAAAITRVARLYLAGEINHQDYLDWVNDTLADAGLSRAVEYNFYPFGAVVYREPPWRER
jgi:hypothetical protein